MSPIFAEEIELNGIIYLVLEEEPYLDIYSCTGMSLEDELCEGRNVFVRKSSLSKKENY